MKRSPGRASKRRNSRPRRSAGAKRALVAISPAHGEGEVQVAPVSTPPTHDGGRAEDSPSELAPNAPGIERPAALVRQVPVDVEPAVLQPGESLSKRASLAAESPQGIQGSRVEEFLGFRLDSEEYCVWIRSIKEIIRPPEITPIPRSPADILGLISLRGTIVPIFNIRRRLGLPTGDVGPKARIVVVVLDAGPVGMVVDHVTEVISVDPGSLEPPPPTMGEREAPLVTATVRLRDRIIGVLHLERLVAIEVETPLRAAA